jgi:hypothetical protein
VIVHYIAIDIKRYKKGKSKWKGSKHKVIFREEDKDIYISFQLSYLKMDLQFQIMPMGVLNLCQHN